MNVLITHVIFDLDGVLLDTEKFYTAATQDILKPYGLSLDWDTKSRMIGRDVRVAAQILIDALQLPLSVTEYVEQRDRRLREYFPHAQAMPGAVALTDDLRARAVPHAIATSSPAASFALKMQQHQAWLQQFAAVICGDSAGIQALKPAPDVFLAAAAAMNAPPTHCLVFEDSPAGIQAAKAAGMSVVALTDPVYNPEIYQAADLRISHLSDFDPSRWGL
jgi:HAD superfamily hydrolase (TIGR01509 family)